jgi:hypothetical protein
MNLPIHNGGGSCTPKQIAPGPGDKIGKEKVEGQGIRKGRQQGGHRKGIRAACIPIETLIEKTILALRPVEKEIGLGS